MTFDEQAKRHKKRQAAHAANKASTGTQTSPEKETNVTAQDRFAEESTKSQIDFQ
jgi:hypothetical protein